ncbi:hypothetical protein J6590_034986 [Homalodisca vitripennis]|nr:hypothetical protein J6590_034986 [Homalodisca vitripennis]
MKLRNIRRSLTEQHVRLQDTLAAIFIPSFTTASGGVDKTITEPLRKSSSKTALCSFITDWLSRDQYRSYSKFVLYYGTRECGSKTLGDEDNETGTVTSSDLLNFGCLPSSSPCSQDRFGSKFGINLLQKSWLACGSPNVTVS